MPATTMIVAGVVLALIIIAIAAFAITRRRRRLAEEQEWADARTMGYQTFESEAEREPEIYEEQPAIVAPDASAFAWGNEPAADESVVEEAEERTHA
jgi:flagellar biosynthesis/type III secretory pathway M-ring protein FliF/YscJ